MAFGAIGVRHLFFSSLGDAFEKPNASKLGETEKKLAEIDPLGRLVAFPVSPQDPEKDHWIVSCSKIPRARCRTDFKHKRTACLFCSLPGSPGAALFDYRLPTLCRLLPANIHCISETVIEKSVKSLTWFSRRYVELCLFRFLQSEANSGGKISEGRGNICLVYDGHFNHVVSKWLEGMFTEPSSPILRSFFISSISSNLSLITLSLPG